MTTISMPKSELLRQWSYNEWQQGVRNEYTAWVDEVFAMLDQQDEDEFWKSYKVEYEPAKMGDWELANVEIPKRSYERLYHVIGPQNLMLDRDTGWGPTTTLKHKGRVWMSDTRAEILEHSPLINKLWWCSSLEPTVLINGLGLGMAVKACLVHNASRIDVVEIDQDVIDIIAPNFANEPRVHIHHADAFEIEWVRGTKWTLAWHDIWPTISSENIEGMDRLTKKYKHRVQWQASWQRQGCLNIRKNDKKFKEALENGDWETVKRIDPEF